MNILEQNDPEVFKAIAAEETRQRDELELIASENYTSRAVMQAVGSYRGGRMLFLGLGTGLGSAMIADGVIEPLELAHLPFRKKTFEDYVGERGLKRRGKKKWTKDVFAVVGELAAAMEPDEVVLGGGGVDELEDLPDGCRRGENENAFLGGFRLWDPDWASNLE